MWHKMRDGSFEGAPPIKFCVKPDPLTFIARFPAFGCIDTFALSFLREPLTVLESPPAANGILANLERPIQNGGAPTVLDAFLFYNEADELELYLWNIPVNVGASRHRFICEEYDGTGERIGAAGPAEYGGVFVHPDTIRGYFFYASTSGSLSQLAGDSLEVDFVRTRPH
jgi:hypothetical protein